MPGGSTTCTGMCGSGVQTGTTRTTTPIRQRTIRLAQRQVFYLRDKEGSHCE